MLAARSGHGAELASGPTFSAAPSPDFCASHTYPVPLDGEMSSGGRRHNVEADTDKK